MAEKTITQKVDELTVLVKNLMEIQMTILKRLNLVPVSKEEEKQFQIQMRESMRIKDDVTEELDEMERYSKREESPTFDIPKENVYSDVLGPDYNNLKL